MACAKQYWNLAGASLCGVGSLIGGIVSGASGQVWLTVAAGFGVLGSIAWAISGYLDLADCLEANNRSADAAIIRQHATALQTEHDKLLSMLQAA
jgi:hypothetical protein